MATSTVGYDVQIPVDANRHLRVAHEAINQRETAPNSAYLANIMRQRPGSRHRHGDI